MGGLVEALVAGIPKFYRWLSERYPLINQPIASTHVPIIDNLYLDMNGIIHNCTHGNDPNVKMTEEEMILKIFEYIEKLFQIIQPQQLLFAAIDGELPLSGQASAVWAMLEGFPPQVLLT